MRRLLITIVLEAYAFGLAWLRLQGGVLTDEAKYLLNIPYPHPPLARSVLSWTEVLPQQELLWRIIFATLLVQAVWLVADMGRSLSRAQRFTLCCAWLVAPAVLLQAGAVLMAPLSALQGLVFLWLLSRSPVPERYLPWLSLFWLACLFTAYQVVLFIPIVAAVFWRAQGVRVLRFSAFLLPLALVALYVVSHPIALAAFIVVREQSIEAFLGERFAFAFDLWWRSAGPLVAALATLAILQKQQRLMLWTLTLVFLYVFLSNHSYYLVLLLPVLIASLQYSPVMLRAPVTTAGLIVIITLIFYRPYLPERRSVAPVVAQALAEQQFTGPVLMVGSFGHEWQHALPNELIRYSTELTVDVSEAAVVCLEQCPDDVIAGRTSLMQGAVSLYEPIQ